MDRRHRAAYQRDVPHVARLTLTDFRSYATADIVAGPGLISVTGDNGQGKTNLLEAVSLLSPGRGLRGVALSEMARERGAGGFAVAATVEAEGGAIDVGTGTAAASPERRVLRINGAAAPMTRLGEWLSLLWLTPAMDRLFAEPPSARRRFLDRLVLALVPGHAHETVRYDAAMRARTRLLTGENADPAWLTALELAMAEHGANIARARAETVAALGEVLAATPPGPFAQPLLALAGNDAHDLAPRLANARSADAAAGRALTGPHRADLVVRHAAKAEPASRGSTGEQKALLIAIILAHADLVRARTARAPILLLDEIAAHLDAARRAALFERLAATGSQVWMTGTDAALFDDAGAQRLRLEGGQVYAG